MNWFNSNFIGLTYDSNHNLLYGLNQNDNSVYVINPVDLKDSALVASRIFQASAVGIVYDAATDTLYATFYETGPNSWLVKIDPTTGSTTIAALLPGVVSSLAYADGTLYASRKADLFSAPYISRIDPLSGTVYDLFAAPTPMVHGLAINPDDNTAYTWTNSSTGDFYASVNLDTGAYQQLAHPDASAVVIGAMVYENFYVATAKHEVNFNEPVPDPGSTLLLLGMGLAGLGAWRRRWQ